jgi:hypothetical protein
MTDERSVRIRTAARDRRKALEHYQDLRRAGKIKRAVVIAELTDESFTVLGQMLEPSEIAQLLFVAVEALQHIDAKRTQPTLEPHEEPLRRGTPTRGTLPPRKITHDADGVMVPPEGENIISCGECSHPRWYVLLNNVDETPARYACAHCGNEVVFHQIMHRGGTA